MFFTCPNFTKLFLCVTCGCGWVFLWRCWNMLRTSGFVDDVTHFLIIDPIPSFGYFCSVVSGRQNTPLYLLTVVTFNQNRCIQNSHETVNAYWHCRILWEAGSMKRYGDHTSVPFARCSSMLQVCCCGPGRYIDRLLQQWRANAGSATLTAYDLNADLFGFTGISLIRI